MVYESLKNHFIFDLVTLLLSICFKKIIRKYIYRITYAYNKVWILDSLPCIPSISSLIWEQLLGFPSPTLPCSSQCGQVLRTPSRGTRSTRSTGGLNPGSHFPSLGPSVTLSFRPELIHPGKSIWSMLAKPNSSSQKLKLKANPQPGSCWNQARFEVDPTESIFFPFSY